MIEPVCTTQHLSWTKDAILAVAALVGIYVALRGLSTWNRQLKGGVEYELTRRLLRCTYRLREAIKGVRHPMMTAAEMPSPPADDPRSNSPEDRRFYGLSQAYQRRWDKVSDVRNDLQTELLEAEVIWGPDIHERFEPLFKLQQELYADIYSYLVICDPREPAASRESMGEIRRKRRDVLYDMLGAQPDEFASDFSAAVSQIEASLKPHLRK